MDTHKKFWFVAQLALLIICIIFIETIYFENILPDKKVPERFQQAQCTIIDKKLAVIDKIWQRYRADFYVNFTANRDLFQAITSANGLERAYTMDRQSQLDALNQYSIGEHYPCWYDPGQPDRVVLVLRHNWVSTFPILVFAVIAIIMLYYLMRTLMGFASLKTKEKPQKNIEKKSKRKD